MELINKRISINILQLLTVSLTEIHFPDIRKSERRRHVRNYAAFDAGEESILQTCSGCNMPPEPDDDTMHIVWYGCDHCTRWWHRHCLEGPAQTTADLLVIDNSTKWRCPACPEEAICGVCLSSVSNLTAAQCYICMAQYHVFCLPTQHQIDYSVLVDLGQKWYCGQCNEQ